MATRMLQNPSIGASSRQTQRLGFPNHRIERTNDMQDRCFDFREVERFVVEGLELEPIVADRKAEGWMTELSDVSFES